MGFCHGVLTNSRPLNSRVTTYAPLLKNCLSPRPQSESPCNWLKNLWPGAGGRRAVKQTVNESLIYPGLERLGLARDALDLVDGVVLTVDRQQWGRLGEIHRTDHAQYFGGDSHRIARAVGSCGGQLVVAIWPLRAVVTLAVPVEGLIVAGSDGVVAGEDGLPGAVGDGDVHVGICLNSQKPARCSFSHGRSAAVDHRGLADKTERLRRLGGFLQRDQRGQLIVGLELLFHPCELYQLLGELVGVQRIKRVLVLQLRRQQRQKRLKVSGKRRVAGRTGPRRAG